MKKFRFKLQTVLEHRKFKEDRLLGELGELRRDEAREIARLATLCAQLADAREAMMDGLSVGEPANELERRDEYAKAMRDDVRVQELTIEVVRERVEAKRLEVIEAIKEREVLETLRDKQERAYMHECARAEQSQLDADASLRYARKT